MNTRKCIIFLLVLLLAGISGLWADETKNGFAIGSNTVFESGKSGGALEISFPLFRKGSFFIRNAVVLSGFARGQDGIIAAGDKIMVGGNGLNNTATYGFVSGSAGTMKTDTDEFFESPLFIEVKLGGGFEIFTSLRNSFAVEAGGGLSFVEDDIDGFAHLAAIFRVYLN
ncbi:MAG: hypothetical protein JW874_08390 [Spirochaetales bacterium]|nr:hypothetical protein [Spirochaetales bacterium]